MKKLKREFEGVTITRKLLHLGIVTFDPAKVNENDYINYANIGFEDLFEDVEDKLTLVITEAPIIEPNEPLVEKTISEDVKEITPIVKKSTKGTNK